MEEVLLMAVLQSLNQLSCEGLNVDLLKGNHPRLQQPHQIMVTVLKHQVEGTFIEGNSAGGGGGGEGRQQGWRDGDDRKAEEGGKTGAEGYHSMERQVTRHTWDGFLPRIVHACYLPHYTHFVLTRHAQTHAAPQHTSPSTHTPLSFLKSTALCLSVTISRRFTMFGCRS